MERKLRSERKCLWCMFVVVFACGCANQEPSNDRAFIDWAREQAITLESVDSSFDGAGGDLIRKSIGSCRLVGIGESRHDTREQLLLKGLLVRRLIEDLGFRALILEESVAHVESLDRYVISGEGDLRDEMNRLAGWYLWDTEEMLELVEWIRQFNQHCAPEQQVRIFGVDITAPALGVREALSSLNAAEVETPLDSRALGLDLQEGDMWPTTWQRYAELSGERLSELAASYEELIATLTAHKTKIVKTSSEVAFERALLLAEIGQIGNALFSSADREQGGLIRERGMARATMRILDREIPGERAILWAHNLHVAKSGFQMPGLAEGELMPMGIELSDKLGEQYLAIGGTFGSGAYPPDLPPGERVFETALEDVMDGALAAVGHPVFLIDLREADRNSAVNTWLRENREWTAQDARAVLVPRSAYDMVYFVDTISRSQPTPLALQRYQLLEGQHQ